MTLTAHAYPGFDLAAVQAKVNTGSDTFKVMLLTAYTFANTHQTITAVKGAGTEVASGAGYTTGGATLASFTASLSAWVVTLTCTNPSWTSSTISPTDAVFYDAQGGTDSTNIPLVHWSFGAAVPTSNGTLLLALSGSGLKTFTDS